MPTRSKVCSRTGCPNLAPCPVHSRPSGAHWSGDRDREQQRVFRRAVLAAADHRCRRCGTRYDLVAHHLRPGYAVTDGVCLCTSCHADVDISARRKRP